MIKLYNQDCLKLMSALPNKSINTIITDLPYGTTACKWDSIIPFEEMWEQVERICSGVFITTASQPFSSALVMSNPEKFKYEWVYQKIAGSNFMQAKYQPIKEHEQVLVFGIGDNLVYNPIMQERASGGLSRTKYSYNPSNTGKRDTLGGFEMTHAVHNGNNELRYPSSVQKFNNRARGDRGLHPTQKPLSLFEYLVKTYTNEGDTVLDFVMGSGTTGLACKNLNRNFIGCELDKNYFEIAKERMGVKND